MDRERDDYIQTPSTSRSNSINEEEERSSSPLPTHSPTEETDQAESSSPKDITTDVAEQIKATIASKRNTFITSSSSSSSSESSETDFVAVHRKDVDSVGSASINAVSLLTG